MAMFIWDAKGVTMVDFLPIGEIVPAACYCNMLHRVRYGVPKREWASSTLVSSFFAQCDTSYRLDHVTVASAVWMISVAASITQSRSGIFGLPSF